MEQAISIHNSALIPSTVVDRFFVDAKNLTTKGIKHGNWGNCKKTVVILLQANAVGLHLHRNHLRPGPLKFIRFLELLSYIYGNKTTKLSPRIYSNFINIFIINLSFIHVYIYIVYKYITALAKAIP